MKRVHELECVSACPLYVCLRRAVTPESVSWCIKASDRELALCWRGHVFLCVFVAYQMGMALHDPALEQP